MRRGLRVIALVMLGWLILSRVMAQTTVPADLPVFLVNLRVDLELLADRVFGGERPANWTNNIDPNSPSIVADIWFDNEQLADAVFGQGERPEDWIGATSPLPALVARNIRHDLELAADTFLGRDLRPDGWLGAPPINRCNRTVLNLAYLLETVYNVELTTLPTVFDYCRAVASEIDNNLVALALEDIDATQVPALTLAVRGDLERLADEKLGLGTRPEGWRGNKDVNSITLADDIFIDLELLADDLLGNGRRPDGWLQALTASSATTFRYLRFDLELLADATLGAGTRPRGWQGEDPLLRCDNLTQSLVLLVQQQYPFEVDATQAADPLFCARLRGSANSLIENPPAPDVVAQEEDQRFRAESQIAFAYLDVAATEYMGIMPKGIKFRAWYRNFAGSSMMFVSGEDFAVFIDRRWTTMQQETFDTLPTLEGVRPLTFCDATWCNGPGPTPTPTGGGPLDEIIRQATPVATSAPGQAPPGGKQLVSWNHIRVNYVLQNPQAGRAQVTLEICRETSQITCEPVTSIFNQSTGVQQPVISQLNGLNVYELPYGYSTNLIIEGATLVSNDIWLNDPTLVVPTSIPAQPVLTPTPG